MERITEKDDVLSYCRQCGGDRFHSIFAEKQDRWQEGDNLCGCDTYSILECQGCRTVTFRHAYWFSEDFEMTDDGVVFKTHNKLYPPSPKRKYPEWGDHVFLNFTQKDVWILKLHKDVYAAAGMDSHALAAMGARTIIDYIVSSQAGDIGSFKEKLGRLEKNGLITNLQKNYFYDAFDAGSAAAHRGYSPKEADVFTLIDVAETLIDRFYIAPNKDRDLARAVDALKSKTPPRKK